MYVECFLAVKIHIWLSGNFVSRKQHIFLKYACPTPIKGEKTSLGLWAVVEAGPSGADQKWADLSASVAKNLNLRSDCRLSLDLGY